METTLPHRSQSSKVFARKLGTCYRTLLATWFRQRRVLPGSVRSKIRQWRVKYREPLRHCLGVIRRSSNRDRRSAAVQRRRPQLPNRRQVCCLILQSNLRNRFRPPQESLLAYSPPREPKLWSIVTRYSVLLCKAHATSLCKWRHSRWV